MGSRIIFLLIKGLSWIPDGVLNGFSRVVYFIIYQVIGYRREIVTKNLANSFPELSPARRDEISRGFYRQFSDIVPEMIRFIRIKPKNYSRRIHVTNQDLLRNYLDEKKNLVIVSGHFGNWEWNILAILATGYRLLAVYKPQSSLLADDLMKKIRQKPGLTLLPMKETVRAIHREQESNSDPFVLLLVADQIPAQGDIHFRTPFLNQDTAFFTGGEKIARKFRMPLLYIDQEKLTFGRYRAKVETLFDGTEALPENAITERFAARLETSVRRNPGLWLWSHRRWKYPRTETISK
ncbi:MAG: hypothetical protein A2X22_10810 [Bacteroidetes bacterium GWF2_49_14]|nr:MAG: hypothetical protein A2X22_10810 [Bacteroidetes bacterium GWF2_49_14]HBB90949.1 hypothetical protein [Bacteroidales bacterium]